MGPGGEGSSTVETVQAQLLPTTEKHGSSAVEQQEEQLPAPDLAGREPPEEQPGSVTEVSTCTLVSKIFIKDAETSEVCTEM